MQQKKFIIVTNKADESIAVANNLSSKLLALKMIFDEQNPEIVFAIGGDGTFLSAVNRFNENIDNIHFITINTGNIGFNALYQVNEIDKLITNLKNNILKTKSLDALKITINNKIFYSLNEIKLMSIAKTIFFTVYINNQLLQNCQSSGFVLTTKTGSTGYTKSINGAVILSEKNLMEFLEIAPVFHNKHNSLKAPLILDNTHTVTIKGNMKDAFLVIDSQKHDFNSDNLIINLIANKIKILVTDVNDLIMINQIQKTFIHN